MALLSVVVRAAPGDLDPTFSGDGKLTDGISRGDDSAHGTAVQPDGKIVVAGYSWNGLNLDIAVARYNPDGSLDTTFGNGSRVTTALGSGDDGANSVVIQTDGKIVVAGWSDSDFAVVRYNPDGSADTSFDDDGKVATSIGTGEDRAHSLVMQADGKIVVAGYAHDAVTGYAYAVARYNANGSLDTAFDGDGKVITDVLAGPFDMAFSVAIQTNGKIVTAGRASVSGNFDFAVVRYNEDGSLDTSFDGDGKVTTPIGPDEDDAWSVAIQPDGKIIAAGTSTDGSAGYNFDFALVRYNGDGSLDTTFGGDGKVTTPIGSSQDEGKAVVIQADGKIVAAGSSYTGQDFDFAAVRYNSNGSLDTTFDLDGKVTASVLSSTDEAYSSAIQPNGKIVVAGDSLNGSNNDFAIVRYNPDGSLDPAFDSDGKVTTDFGFFDGNALHDTAIQPDGKTVAAGEARGNFAVVRYNSDGSPDTTFGGTGKVSTDMGSSGDVARAVAIQPDGKILVAGLSLDFDDNQCCFALARYSVDGSLDNTFSDDGKVITGNFTFGDGAHDVVIQPNGKIVAAGSADNNFTVIRYNANGSLDTSFDNDGIATTPIGGRAVATSVAIQPDGKIAVAGTSTPANGSNPDFAIARYNTNGSLDASFDGDGIVTTDIVSDDYAEDVSIQSDGKIVAAGCASFLYDFPCNVFALARFNTNGSLDTTFDSDGKVTTPFVGGFHEAYLNSVAIRPDGKIIAAGYADSGVNNDFALALYNLDGSLDTTFGGGDGKTTADFDISNDKANGMALDNVGRAVVVGRSDGRFAIARFRLGGSRRAIADFDGDGRSDISVFRPSDSVWYLNRSTEGFASVQFGLATDKITPADFDADGKADIAVFRDGTWWRMNSSNATVTTDSFGLPGDIPVPADYTGDGRDELAVYRNGQWWALDLSNNQSSLINFGLATDKPVAADYDGDGRVDQAVYRNGEWHINRSTLGYAVLPFGLPSDRPLVGDYDGDFKADLAVYRDGTWYVQQSTAGFSAFQWGLSTDIPTPGDYDGDGKLDAAVYRDGIWYVLKSTGGVSIQHFGLANDKPVPAAFVN